MLPQTTLKRQAEADVNFSNDDLDENEYEITWGNKRSRYIYTYNLQSPDLFSNINDSNQTESVYSQLKSTIEVGEELNFSSDTSSCENDSDSNYQNSSQSFGTDTEDTEKEIILGIDNGYLADENLDDSFIANSTITPAFFQNCVYCAKTNDNPHYQYCNTCFKHRMQLFEANPSPIMKRRINQLNKLTNCKDVDSFDFTYSQESNSLSSQETILPNSHESNQSNAQESSTFGLSGLNLSKDITDKLSRTELCNICFLKPKNGIFNHKKTGHVYCCYSCAKNIWIRSGKCPVCKLKIKYVTKVI